jgi:amino acid permease
MVLFCPSVRAGVLAIPSAFAETGLPLGVACFTVVAFVCLGTMLILLDCQRLVREQKGVEVVTYEDLAGVVLGRGGFRAVQVTMAVLTLIFCTAFVIVVSTNLNSVFASVGRVEFCLIVFPILMALSWIPHIKDLWVASVFGLVVYLVGVVGSTIYYSRVNFVAHADTMDLRWDGLGSFFGVAVYSLEGINLTLPVGAASRSTSSTSSTSWACSTTS